MPRPADEVQEIVQVPVDCSACAQYEYAMRAPEFFVCFLIMTVMVWDAWKLKGPKEEKGWGTQRLLFLATVFGATYLLRFVWALLTWLALEQPVAV